MKTRHIPLILLLTGLLVFNLACSDDEENNITGNNNQQPQFDDPVLENMAVEGAAFASGLVEMFPNWMQGQLGKKDATTPTFDPTCTCWRWTDNEGSYENPLFTWCRNWTFALTYYQEGVAQEGYEGADSIGVVVGYAFSKTDYRNEANSYSSNFYFSITLSGVPNGPDSIMISGGGEGELNGEYTVGETTTPIYETIQVMLNLTMPVIGGCPAGGLDMDTQYTSFSIGFDGGSTGYWYYITGPGQEQHGEIPLTCGK